MRPEETDKVTRIGEHHAIPPVCGAQGDQDRPCLGRHRHLGPDLKIVTDHKETFAKPQTV